MLVPRTTAATGRWSWTSPAKERRADPSIAKLPRRHHPRTPEFMSRADPGQAAPTPLSDIYASHRRVRDVHRQVAVPGRNAQEMMIARLRGQPQAAPAPRRSLRGPGGRAARAMERTPTGAITPRSSSPDRAHRIPRRRFPVENQGEAEIGAFPLRSARVVEWKPDPAIVRGSGRRSSGIPSGRRRRGLPVETKLAVATPACCARGCTTFSSSAGYAPA